MWPVVFDCRTPGRLGGGAACLLTTTGPDLLLFFCSLGLDLASRLMAERSFSSDISSYEDGGDVAECLIGPFLDRPVFDRSLEGLEPTVDLAYVRLDIGSSSSLTSSTYATLEVGLMSRDMV